MNLLLFGPPGAGKGTQSALLVERLKMKHLSTGDLFRHAIKNSTPLGLEAKKFMDQGHLVPDSIVIGMVKEELDKLGQGGFILDGFPRTVPQAEALQELLGKLSLKLDFCLFLEVPRSNLMSRLTGRRVCKSCGATYHIEHKPTKKEGICDLCGSEVIQRNDDKADVIENRLVAYEESTAPLKEFYKKAGILVQLDGEGPSEEVYSRIKKVLA